MSRRIWGLLTVFALVVNTSGCSRDSTAPSLRPTTSLLAVDPAGGATAVSTGAVVTVGFNHAMPPGMAAYVTLHHGDVTGSLVACTVSWSTDSMSMTLAPAASLDSATMYTIHMGGGMKDTHGNPVDLTANGMMGGQWATGSMVTETGMMGGGGPMSGQEMGTGWAGTNGMYGMVFTFTTN